MASGRGGGKFGRFGKVRPRQVPTEPLDYKNVEYLSRFLTPQAKLQHRKRTGFSGQDQRKLANAVKLARFVGLLPYVG